MEITRHRHLLKKINSKRKELIESGEKNGIGHSITIKKSQELDKLINNYMSSKGLSNL